MDRENLTVGDAVKLIRESLDNIYPPGEIRAITELMLEHLLGYSKTGLLLNLDTKIPKSLVLYIEEMISELRAHKPIQYLIGYSWFYGLKIGVSPDVLVPRQETEELVRWVIEEAGSKQIKIADIGTGSGCIAISLAANLPFSEVTAIDISEKAIYLARENAVKCGVNVRFIVEDIFEPVIVKSGKYDILVSNPPYVTESEKLLTGKNVLLYEPVSALFVPDHNALIYYEVIARLGTEVLEQGGCLFFEINEKKFRAVEQLLRRFSYSQIQLKKDIHGKDRMVKAVL